MPVFNTLKCCICERKVTVEGQTVSGPDGKLETKIHKGTIEVVFPVDGERWVVVFCDHCIKKMNRRAIAKEKTSERKEQGRITI